MVSLYYRWLVAGEEEASTRTGGGDEQTVRDVTSLPNAVLAKAPRQANKSSGSAKDGKLPLSLGTKKSLSGTRSCGEMLMTLPQLLSRKVIDSCGPRKRYYLAG
jgi:hypothetical protein